MSSNDSTSFWGTALLPQEPDMQTAPAETKAQSAKKPNNLKQSTRRSRSSSSGTSSSRSRSSRSSGADSRSVATRRRAGLVLARCRPASHPRGKAPAASLQCPSQPRALDKPPGSWA